MNPQGHSHSSHKLNGVIFQGFYLLNFVRSKNFFHGKISQIKKLN